jgi:hypothetical protein
MKSVKFQYKESIGPRIATPLVRVTQSKAVLFCKFDRKVLVKAIEICPSEVYSAPLGQSRVSTTEEFLLHPIRWVPKHIVDDVGCRIATVRRVAYEYLKACVHGFEYITAEEYNVRNA